MPTHEDFVFLICVQCLLNKLDNFVKPLSHVGVHVVADGDVHDRHFVSEILAHVWLNGGHDVRDAESFQVTRCSSCVEIGEVQTRGDDGYHATVGVICIVSGTPSGRLLDEGGLPTGCWEGDHGSAEWTRALASSAHIYVLCASAILSRLAKVPSTAIRPWDKTTVNNPLGHQSLVGQR